MTKQDFIQELTTALAPIDAQTRAEIIADINEHFTEGAAHGQTEEEICINLGQPGQIAEQVLEEYKALQSQEEAPQTSSFNDSLASVLHAAAQATREAAREIERVNSQKEIFSTRETERAKILQERFTAREAERAAREVERANREIERANREIERVNSRNERRHNEHMNRHSERMQQHKERMQQHRERLQRHKEHMHNNIPNQSGPWSNESWAEQHHGTQDESTRVRGGYEINIDNTFAGITGIDIDLTIANIQFVPAQQSKDVRVTIQGRSRYNTFGLENEGGILVVRQKQPFFKFEIFNFKSTLEATIYVPVGFEGNIKAITSVGNMSASGISGNLKLSTSAGNIEIDSHKGNNAHLRSSAGNIILTNCLLGDIDAKSSAGNVKAGGYEAFDLKLGSSAGEIDVHFDKLSGDTNLSTSAGSVILTAQHVQGDIIAKSSAGSVHIYLPQDVNCRIDVKKPSIGSYQNYLTGNPDSPYVLRAATSVGSITLEALDPRQN